MKLQEKLKYSKYELVKRKVYLIQRKDLNVDFLFDFYLKPENHNVVLKIYEESEFVGAWGRWDILTYQDNMTIDYDLCNFVYNQEIDKGDEKIDSEYIDRIFSRFYRTTFIALKDSYDDGEAIFIALKDISHIIKNIRTQVQTILRQKNIQFYTIGLYGEFGKKNELLGNCGIPFYEKLFWIESRKNEATDVSHTITDVKYENAKCEFLQNNNLIDKTTVNSQKPKIYIVGPCIVYGNIHMKKDRLSVLLSNIAEEYQIIKVVEWYTWSECFSKILEYDIRENDLIFFVVDIYDEKNVDIDMNLIFSKTNSNKWLYTNVMIHTTRYGNELILNEIISKILTPIREKGKNILSENILHKKETQWITPDLIINIQRYINEIKNISNIPNGVIGAIVMNANPFTNGHRYLVEYASKQVDFLYLFVVEEDLSEVPFSVRMKLVKDGTKDLKNVSVVRSGQFIISKETFRGYFEKEVIGSSEIDVTKDIEIFGKIIAKELGITKRFVGEEPLDIVTQKYNQEMKEILPKYGVELIEIPRKKIQNNVISATKVRRYFYDKNWDEMFEYVPQTTYDFLVQHQENLDTLRRPLVDIIKDEEFERIKTWLLTHENIVIYGVGKNAEFLIPYIPANIMNTVRFCDKKASEETLYFEGKKVISPKELTDRDNILISSTQYGKEIYENLRRHGIAYEHIFNLLPYVLR